MPHIIGHAYNIFLKYENSDARFPKLRAVRTRALSCDSIHELCFRTLYNPPAQCQNAVERGAYAVETQCIYQERRDIEVKTSSKRHEVPPRTPR